MGVLSRISKTPAAVVLLSLCAPFAPAALLYDNGVPDHVNGSGISNFRTVDDFTLTGPANLNAIRFWAVFNNNDPTGMFSGNLSWAIYTNAGGTVGSLFASGSLTGLTMTDTGNGGGNFNAYQIDFSIGAPVALGAGVYWLELHDGAVLTTADGSETYWATKGTGGNARTQPFFGSFPTDLQPISSYFGCQCDYDLAFQLFGDADNGVPEPATVWLSGTALLALLWRRLKSN